MLCEHCQAKDATIHLTQVMDGEVRKLHLCEACAAAGGLDPDGALSISDVLLGLGADAAPSEDMPTGGACPSCGLKRSAFRKSGRLGCPDCYEAFADELTPLIRSMHRDVRHRGKAPADEREKILRRERRAALSERLADAVESECFEEAARLRDELAALDPRPAGGAA
jgi:protein arginine kinase activator